MGTLKGLQDSEYSFPVRLGFSVKRPETNFDSLEYSVLGIFTYKKEGNKVFKKYSP